jgi:hypothetical protein
MSTIKKNQHYVWKHYLKPWTTNGQINCLHDGKPFKASLNKIAQQNYFYKSNPINIEEIEFAKYFIGILDPMAKESLSNLLRFYHFTANTDDYLMKCGIEDFHEKVETNFIPLLAKLYMVDLSFLKNIKEKNDFSIFIGCQYSRTNNMRSRLTNSKITVPENVDVENFAKIFSLFMAEIIGNWVSSKAGLQFLNNMTSKHFITSDQPVFNLKGTDSTEIAPSEFELFYPISPTQAIILSENNIQSLIEIEDVEKVKWFNRKIQQNAKEQIYAKKEEDLIIK